MTWASVSTRGRARVQAIAGGTWTGAGVVLRWLVAEFWPQEVTLVVGLALLFYGLTHRFDVSIACIVCGAIVAVLAWPRRAALPVGPSTSPSHAAPPRSRG